ncbi:MAG TPA: MFS transporter, partial [Albitalea sp.]
MTDGAGAEPRRPLWRVVFALGLTQIIAWGSLHYSIAVLAPDMAATLGVSVPLVLGCFTGALAMSGLAAPTAGRWIDRAGGRRPMAAGSVLAALALVLIAGAQHPAVFLAGWLLAGAAMSATLYDAAFATLSLVS